MVIMSPVASLSCTNHNIGDGIRGASPVPNSLVRRQVPDARLIVGSAPTRSSCGPFTCAPRVFGPWNENVGRHAEARAQPLHHCQAQFLLASKHLADAAR